MKKYEKLLYRIALFSSFISCIFGCGDSEPQPPSPVPPPPPPKAYLSLTPNLSNYRTLETAIVTVTFDDQPFDPATISQDSLYITEGEDPSSPRVMGSIGIKGNSVIFVPDAHFNFGIHYKVWFTQAVKGYDGKTYDWVFRDVTYGNTELPAPGGIFVVNIPNNLNDTRGSDSFPLIGYIPPSLCLDPQKTNPEIPEQIPGISATEAWKLSTGRPDVLVVVLDTGLGSYNPPQILNNLFLSRGELPLPRDAAGNNICESIPVCPDPYDYNQDGRFNIQDYRAADKAIDPDGNLIALNKNITPEDLFTLFMDGIDGYPADPDAPPDTGGLVDDISGYDFLRDEPRALGISGFPEGDHGEGRAIDIAGEADVELEIPGACPNCTVMVCRVTYTLIQFGEILGNGIRYAVEKGADAIVAVLGSINGTAEEVAALQFAEDHGIPVVIGMSDESSFHQTMPSTFNHTINSKCNISFFIESFCTMYGGQTHFSACGQCGSDAGGFSAGAVGLLLSRARDLGYCTTSHPEDPDCTEPDLSANEVKQVLTLTAEKPVNLDSCFGFTTDASCKHTWDWHQGYGRINLFKALKRLEASPLPPDVQILSPGWFAILNPALSSASKLTARIRSRIPIESYTCEWAKGIEPDEIDFQPFECTLGPDGTMEADMPLDDMAQAVGGATTIPKNPQGKTITVRIRAYVGDAYGEDRRAYAVHRDPTWLPGFPISLIDTNGDGKEEISPGSENAPSLESSPALEDIDGDDADELIIATSNGQLHVIKYSAQGDVPYEHTGYPILLPQKDRFSKGVFAAPSVGDLDKDGYPDIVVATVDGYVYAYRGIDGWPIAGPDGTILEADPPSNVDPESFGAGNPFYSSPVLSDMNNDSYLDVIVGCGDQKVYVADGKSIAQGDPRRMPGWPVKPADPAHCSQLGVSIMGTAATEDLTGDGLPEVIIGTSEECQTPVKEAGRLYAIRSQGTLHPDGPIVPGFPVQVYPNPFGVEIPLPPLSTGIASSPVVARQGNDVLIGVSAFFGPATMIRVKVRTGRVSVNKLTLISFGIAGSGAFNRGKDGVLAYASPMVTIGPDGKHGMVSFVNLMQLFYPGICPLPVQSLPVFDQQFLSSPSFADVDGDCSPEVIAVSGGHFVQAYGLNGAVPQGWPKFTNGWHMASPAFGDLDGDGFLEMVAPVRIGRIFAWDTDGDVCDVHPWMTFHHDNYRTGNLETSLYDAAIKRCQ